MQDTGAQAVTREEPEPTSEKEHQSADAILGEQGVVRLDIFAKAIKNAITKRKLEEEEALRIAETVLNMFGFSDTILDNVLEQDERDLFYMLEDECLLNWEDSEETTLYDGREWRIHRWRLNAPMILARAGVSLSSEEALLIDPETNPMLSYSDPTIVTEDMWHRRSEEQIPTDPIKAQGYAIMRRSWNERPNSPAEPSEIRHALKAVHSCSTPIALADVPSLLSLPSGVAVSIVKTAISMGFLTIKEDGELLVTTVGREYLKTYSLQSRAHTTSKSERLEDIVSRLKQTEVTFERAPLKRKQIEVLNAIRTHFFYDKIPHISLTNLEGIFEPEELNTNLSALIDKNLVEDTSKGIILTYQGLSQYVRSLSLRPLAYLILSTIAALASDDSKGSNVTIEEISTKSGLRNPSMFAHLLRYFARQGLIKEEHGNGSSYYSISSSEMLADLITILEKSLPETIRGDNYSEFVKHMTTFRGLVLNDDGSINPPANRVTQITPIAPLREKVIEWQGTTYVLVDVGLKRNPNLAEKVLREHNGKDTTAVPLTSKVFDSVETITKHSYDLGTDFAAVAHELGIIESRTRALVIRLVEAGIPLNVTNYSKCEIEFQGLLKEWGGEEKRIAYDGRYYTLVNINARVGRAIPARKGLVIAAGSGRIPLTPDVYEHAETIVRNAYPSFLCAWQIQQKTGLEESRVFVLANALKESGISIPTNKPALEDLVKEGLVPWLGEEKTVTYQGAEYTLIDIGQRHTKKHAEIVKAHCGQRKLVPVSTELFKRVDIFIQNAHPDKDFTDYAAIQKALGLLYSNVNREIQRFRKLGILIPANSRAETTKPEEAHLPEITLEYLGEKYTFVDAGRRVRKQHAKQILDTSNGEKLPVNHNLFAALPIIFKYARKAGVDLERICEETELTEISIRAIIRRLNALGSPISKNKISLDEMTIAREKNVRFNGIAYRLVSFGLSDYLRYAKSAKDRLGKNVIALTESMFDNALVCLRNAHKRGLDFETIIKETGISTAYLYVIIKKLRDAGLPIPTNKHIKTRETSAARTDTHWTAHPYRVQIASQTYACAAIGDRGGRCLPIRRELARNEGLVPLTDLENTVLKTIIPYLIKDTFDVREIAKKLDRPVAYVVQKIRDCFGAGITALKDYARIAEQQIKTS